MSTACYIEDPCHAQVYVWDGEIAVLLGVRGFSGPMYGDGHFLCGRVG